MLRVYQPESELADPELFFRSATRDLRRAFLPAFALLKSNIQVRYRQTLLGWWWAFLPPIITAVAATLARHADVLSPRGTPVPFPLFVIIGTALWQSFAEAVLAPAGLLIQLRPMLTKINFPREAIGLAALLQSLVACGPRLLLIAAACLWYGAPLGLNTIIGFWTMLPLVALGVTVGTIISPLTVLYDDVMRLLSLALGGVLFITPVIYPIPENGFLRFLVLANPLTPLLETGRQIFVGLPVTMGISYLLVSCVTLAALVAAWIVVRIAFPLAVERLSS